MKKLVTIFFALCLVVLFASTASASDFSFDSCSASPSSAVLGEEVTWTANVSGGLAPYSAEWSGDDGLSGSDLNTSITYTSAGSKSASVESVTSSDGNVLIGPFSCGSIEISEPAPDPLSVSCSPSPSSVKTGNSVTWSASVSGGLAPFTYSWSGDDSLSGSDSSVTTSYSTIGTKNAKLDVSSSDGQVVLETDCLALEVKSSSGGGGDDDDDDSTATSTATTTDSGASGGGKKNTNNDDKNEDDQDPIIEVLGLIAEFGSPDYDSVTPEEIAYYMAKNLANENENGGATSGVAVGTTSDRNILGGQTAGLFSLFYNDSGFSWQNLIVFLVILIAIGGIVWFFIMWKRDEEEDEKQK